MAINSSCSPWASACSSVRSRASSASSVSAWDWTDTYSPAAIDIAPATRPATPATTTVLCVAWAAAIPSTRLAVDTMPSLAPRTAARTQPMRPVRWRSLWCLAMPVVSVMGGHRAPMPPSPLRRLDSAGLAVGQRAHGLLGWETALPQKVRLTRVVQERIVPYHAAVDIFPQERWPLPVTQNPAHTALGSPCFSRSHSHSNPLY